MFQVDSGAIQGRGPKDKAGVEHGKSEVQKQVHWANHVSESVGHKEQSKPGSEEQNENSWGADRAVSPEGGRVKMRDSNKTINVALDIYYQENLIIWQN